MYNYLDNDTLMDMLTKRDAEITELKAKLADTETVNAEPNSCTTCIYKDRPTSENPCSHCFGRDKHTSVIDKELTKLKAEITELKARLETYSYGKIEFYDNDEKNRPLIWDYDRGSYYADDEYLQELKTRFEAADAMNKELHKVNTELQEKLASETKRADVAERALRLDVELYYPNPNNETESDIIGDINALNKQAEQQLAQEAANASS